MTGDQLVANIEQYLQAAGLNVPPPLITSDPLVSGGVPIEQLLRVLCIAANASDPQDNAENTQEHVDRDTKVNEAAANFTAQDEAAASQLAQQMPQLATGIASSLGGALGGMLQPITQMPQQIAQGAQQAMQAAMGMAQQFGGSASTPSDEALYDLSFPDELDSGTAEFTEGGGGGGGGGALSPTAPMAMLGPPPVPSAATTPSSVPAAPVLPSTVPSSAPAHSSGMGAMPMMPPGAMRGAEGSSQDAKAESKRLSVAPVKNGAPVQGRLVVPPSTPHVVKKIEGKPVATKRIIMPSNRILQEPDDIPHRS